MKRVIVFAGTVVMGLVVGWYCGYNLANHRTTNVVHQTVKTMEASDATQAVFDARVIGFIEAGEKERAVRVLCQPIASYYYTYDNTNGESKMRSAARAVIENLMKTNSIVAAEVSQFQTNMQ